MGYLLIISAEKASAKAINKGFLPMRSPHHQVIPQEGVAYHAELHALLIPNRGVALDKDGTGFTPGRAVTYVRLISKGVAVRRLAAKAMLLQLGSRVEAMLRERNQHGAETKNGADLV